MARAGLAWSDLYHFSPQLSVFARFTKYSAYQAARWNTDKTISRFDTWPKNIIPLAGSHVQ